ncbi:MAG: hypothetical protein ACRD0H_10640 [Actinomycetes bacterium]
MEDEDSDAVVESFAPAAEAAVVSGLDGVEVHAALASLLRQFLSGLGRRVVTTGRSGRSVRACQHPHQSPVP